MGSTPAGYRWITRHGVPVLVPDEDFELRQDLETGNWVNNRVPEVKEFVSDKEAEDYREPNREFNLKKSQQESKRLNEETARRDREIKAQRRAEARRRKIEKIEKELGALKKERYNSFYLHEQATKKMNRLSDRLKKLLQEEEEDK